MIPSRQILSNAAYSRNHVAELLQAIFTAEFIRPSKTLWLVSPWLSDIQVMDNRHGGFSALLADSGQTSVTLSNALVRLASRGTEVTVVTRTGESEEFLSAVRSQVELASGFRPPHLKSRDDLHAKGLLGDDYSLLGSMNFTFGGLYKNNELIIFAQDLEQVADLRLTFEKEYG